MEVIIETKTNDQQIDESRPFGDSYHHSSDATASVATSQPGDVYPLVIC
jgi:hypothetical protein